MASKFINIRAYHQSDLFDPVSEREMGLDRLSLVLPPALAELELSRDKYIDIPV
jgi:predicted alternative tryptophan synthase beta-subunit